MERAADSPSQHALLGEQRRIRLVLIGVLLLVLVLSWKYFSFWSVGGSADKMQMRIDDGTSVPSDQAMTHPESVLSFDPVESQIRPGESITLEAVLDTGTNHVSGAELHVRFDPSQMTLEQMSAAPAFALSLQEPNIDNKRGTASIALGVPLEKPAVTGRQSIVTLRFRTKPAFTNTEVAFDAQSLLAADDEPGSVIRETRSAHIAPQP